MERTRLLADLERLAGKYRALAALRERREAAEALGLARFGRDEAAARGDEFRRVAREFPGALRELDVTPAAVLAGRARDVETEIAQLRAEPGRGAPGRAWVTIVLDYHATLRELLVAKLWLSANVPRGGLVTDEIAERYRAWRRASGDVLPAELDVALLAGCLRPPGGRLNPLVWEALERRHGLPREEIERAVFGAGAAG